MTRCEIALSPSICCKYSIKISLRDTPFAAKTTFAGVTGFRDTFLSYEALGS